MAVNLRASPQLTTLRQTGRRLPSGWLRVLRYGGGLCRHGSNGPNGSTGPASRYHRPANLGDDTALTGQSSQQWLASMEVEMEPAIAGPP